MNRVSRNRILRRMPIPILLASAALCPLAVSAQSALPSTAKPTLPAKDAGRYQFTKIGIKHYDAGVMADLITRPDGIIVVPPNFVVPANPVAPTSAAAGPPKAAPSVQANVQPNTQTNVLPPGVRRIFVLESDNSLVIEATPDGLAQLSLSEVKGTN